VSEGPDWWSIDPLADPPGLAAAADGAEAILCLAGVVTGRSEALERNADLACAAVRAGAQTGCPVLIASSAAVYGIPEDGYAFTESDAPDPVSAYGRAKRDAETRATVLAQALGVRATHLRIGNVAGADACLGGWHPGTELDRFADGATPARSYIGPRTLARVLDALCGRKDLPGVLNVAAPGTVEMGALLDAAELAWRSRPAPDTAIRRVALDVTRLGGLVELDPAAGDAGTLVSEWKATGLQP
jgi:nucleoside-diphosphate-sugar epimerase